MSDSFLEANLSIKSDPHLWETYVNFHGAVRYGRLLEDLDVLGVLISYKHVWNPIWDRAPMSIVTASVDDLTLFNKGEALDPELDLRFTGQVTWVGSSSIEVTMHVDQQQLVEDDSNWSRVLTAKFVNASRDPRQAKAFPVNELLLESPEDRKIFDLGESAKCKRLKSKRLSVLSTEPTVDEVKQIHSLFLETIDAKSGTFHRRTLPQHARWLSESMVKTAHLCQPQQRNVYNKIFGGFLMRKAFELAYIVMFNFSKSPPFLTNIDDISFRAPVLIGDCLYLSSQVVYVEGHYAQVRVHAEVLHPTTGQRTSTNDFHFTFRTKLQPHHVIPKTYSEAMLFIDGRRRFHNVFPNNTS